MDYGEIMLKVGICIDDWKLPIFERKLLNHGYQYEKAGALTEDTLVLVVMTNSVKELEAVVRAANLEAAESARKSI